MKRIENILRKYGYIFKILFFVLWLLWAVQLWGPLTKEIEKEANYQRERITPDSEKASELVEFIDQKLQDVALMGKSYSPQKHIEDLKEIELKVGPYSELYPHNKVNRLWELCYINIRNGYYSNLDMAQAASNYRAWNEKQHAKRGEALRELRSFGWQGILSWLVVLYRRTIYIALFLYLIRMAERNGILETILAEKKKFVLATILWPIYFFKYPYNVVREIRVEAELRRFKGLFRVFSVKEARLVREVANSSYYKQWLAEFHQQNGGSFKKGLFLALIATLFLHLLFPCTAKASEKKIRDYLSMSITENSQQIEQQTDDDSQDTNQLGIPPITDKYGPPLVAMIVRFVKEIIHSEKLDKIDRVPRTSLFGNLTRVINQIRKGITDEHSQKDNLLGCITIWNDRKCVCW